MRGRVFPFRPGLNPAAPLTGVRHTLVFFSRCTPYTTEVEELPMNAIQAGSDHELRGAGEAGTYTASR